MSLNASDLLLTGGSGRLGTVLTVSTVLRGQGAH